MNAGSCWCGPTVMSRGAATHARPTRSPSWIACAGPPRRNGPKPYRPRMPSWKTGDPMDDLSDQHHGTHTHGGRVHVHASVDHLAGAVGASARLGIRLDGALMRTLGVAADDIVRIATERGRSILA